MSIVDSSSCQLTVECRVSSRRKIAETLETLDSENETKFFRYYNGHIDSYAAHAHKIKLT